jgi:pyruvate,water dikinase
MKMVRADTASSGVIFTLDTESGFRDVVLVTGSYGLGENIVQGTVQPDEFYVFKPTTTKGTRAVLRRSLGSKEQKLVLDGADTRNVATSEAERARYCLTDDEVVTLAQLAMRIEAHYSEQAGTARPIDAEWAKDGEDGQLYIVQARPETVASQRPTGQVEVFRLKARPTALITGQAIGQRVASGVARVVRNTAELQRFRSGEILVADTTSPDWGTVMQASQAIVTNRGGRTCHAAILARELGVPAVVGTERGTESIQTGETITVSCAEGDVGVVYRGAVPFEMTKLDITRIERPRTKVMLNIGNPGVAFRSSFLPNDGVGLARMEFIVNEWIKVHPLALIHPEKVEDAEACRYIARLSANYPNGADFFVERLSEGIGTIAAAFYPKPVIVRLSDFKTNEYAHLVGGTAFEPREENPMLGFRGAARYAHPAYLEGFELECRAIKRVRETMGLANVIVMVPFCRRVNEAVKVIRQMEKFGLRRGEHGLELYMMCEIPNNVILIDQFAEHFDGFSIGSNDLTQLALGVDRDSSIVAFDYDERDEGVLALVRMAIEGAHRQRLHIGICGQAPSDYADFAEFLVRLGIDSMSLNPDVVVQVMERVAALERSLGSKRLAPMLA